MLERPLQAAVPAVFVDGGADHPSAQLQPVCPEQNRAAGLVRRLHDLPVPPLPQELFNWLGVRREHGAQGYLLGRRVQGVVLQHGVEVDALGHQTGGGW